MAASNPMQTPPFLTKLYQLVNDPQTSALVSWTDEKGLSFTVHKPSEFGRDILPRYFKHNNFSSFVRQLNQYGFHKQNPDKWMFGHDSFRKDRPDLLKNITRRRPKQTPPTSNAVLPHALAQNAIVELGNYGIEGEVKALKRDKDVLIQELVVTRRNEEQLRTKCSSLEGRVTNLENSSKQMQSFIMHYFSQVLQPYSQAMASRKRKRLPPSSPSSDTMDILVEPQENTVANVSHSPPNPSVDALRAMMQQMGVGMPANPPVPQNPNAANNSIVERSPDGRAFAPATIHELPQDYQANGASTVQRRNTVPRIGPPLANGNPPNLLHGPGLRGPGRKQTVPHLIRQSAPPAVTQTPQLAPTSPGIPTASPLAAARSLSSPQSTGAIANPITDIPNIGPASVSPTPINGVPLEIDPALEFLSDFPNTPNSSMTMDLIETVLEEPKDQQADGRSMYDTYPRAPAADGDLNPSEYDITFHTDETNDSQVPACSSSKDDAITLEEFLELSGDDQPLPPPLTHLPEGTDIHALAKRIESFADSTDG